MRSLSEEGVSDWGQASPGSLECIAEVAISFAGIINLVLHSGHCSWERSQSSGRVAFGREPSCSSVLLTEIPRSQHFRKEGGLLLDLPPGPEQGWAEVAEKTRMQLPSTDLGGLVAPAGPSPGTSQRASHAAESVTTS